MTVHYRYPPARPAITYDAMYGEHAIWILRQPQELSDNTQTECCVKIVVLDMCLCDNNCR